MKKLLLMSFNILVYCLSFGQCHYVIDMQDSYGDGWNGASIDLM